MPLDEFLLAAKPKYTPKSSPALLNRSTHGFLPDGFGSVTGRVQSSVIPAIKLALVFLQKGLNFLRNTRETLRKCGGGLGGGLHGCRFHTQPMQACVNSDERPFNRI